MGLDFSKMMYDLSVLEEGQTILSKFWELKEHEEFSDVDDDVLRWVFLTVDTGSPFFDTYKDFQDRGKAVYNYLKTDNDQLLEYIKDRHETDRYFRVNLDAAIYKKFIILDKINYTAWYTIWINFHETNAFLRMPISPLAKDYESTYAKKQVIRKTLPDLQSELSHYEKQMFGDSSIKKIVTNQVAKFVNYPEKYARNLEKPS